MSTDVYSEGLVFSRGHHSSRGDRIFVLVLSSQTLTGPRALEVRLGKLERLRGSIRDLFSD